MSYIVLKNKMTNAPSCGYAKGAGQMGLALMNLYCQCLVDEISNCLTSSFKGRFTLLLLRVFIQHIFFPSFGDRKIISVIFFINSTAISLKMCLTDPPSIHTTISTNTSCSALNPHCSALYYLPDETNAEKILFKSQSVNTRNFLNFCGNEDI